MSVADLPANPTPEQHARARIDSALARAGWAIQNRDEMNLTAARGVAIREFPLTTGPADYLLFVDGKAVGVLEAKPEGYTLSGVESQSGRYARGFPPSLHPPILPLPFLYESTGTDTRFTNLLDPDPRSRGVFSVHQPDTHGEWLSADTLGTWLRSVRPIGGTAEPEERGGPYAPRPSTLRSRLQFMPPLAQPPVGAGWRFFPNQIQSITNLEASLKLNKPRALIQMATGSGKTLMTIAEVYRLIKYAGARRVLFLVDRTNLGEQAEKEFHNFRTPDDNRKFTELYNVQRLTSNAIRDSDRVVITTVQRLYSMLKGEAEFDPALEEESAFESANPLLKQPLEVVYNPKYPPEFFDVIFIDECHRSIYSLWRQVLEYFDAFLIGLTATPAQHTFGFFEQNLVMEYSHEQAVADRVNVQFEVYRIQTRITEQGSTIEAGPEPVVGLRNRRTRQMRWQAPDEPVTYSGHDLDRAVVAKDQIRTIVRTFRDCLFTELFPGRTEVPKTLIFAKDDSHAEDIVGIVRQEFGRGNAFCQKITYKTTGAKPSDLIQEFRNSYDPRIAVSVDMIATGTDVKPIEIVVFMRAVKSRVMFEQMKGRGVRVIDATDLKAVTPDATAKTHFVIVDCVGVVEAGLSDTLPLERKKSVPLKSLLEHVAMGGSDPDVISSLAARLVRLDREISPEDSARIRGVSGGVDLGDVCHALISALDPDRHVDAASRRFLALDPDGQADAASRRLLALDPDGQADAASRRFLALDPDGQVEAASRRFLAASTAAFDADAASRLVEPTESEVKAAAEALCKAAVAPLATNPQLRQTILDLKAQLEQVVDEVSKDAVLFAGMSEEAKEKARGLVASFEQFIRDHHEEIDALQFFFSRPYTKRLRFCDVKALAEAIKAPPRSWTPDVLWHAYEILEKDRVRGASGHRLLTDVVSLVRFALHQQDELVPFGDQVRTRFQTWLAAQEIRGRRFTPEQVRWLTMIRDHVAANVEIEVEDFDLNPFAQEGGLGRAAQVFGKELGAVLKQLNEALAA